MTSAAAGLVTTTLQVAVLPPSDVVTVMLAEPTATPVTTPLLLTLATLSLLLFHVTFLLVAVEGEIVGESCTVFPIETVVLLGRLTLETEMVLLTVTVQEALAPLLVVAVMVAVPAPTAVTLPDELTVATLVLLLLQVTEDPSDAEAVSLVEPPAGREIEVGDTVTVVVTGAAVTVTLHCASKFPSSDVAVTTASPAVTAVTRPSTTVPPPVADQ